MGQQAYDSKRGDNKRGDGKWGDGKRGDSKRGDSKWKWMKFAKAVAIGPVFW